ncbi:MAG TPA: ABC transporter permease [Terracidiphilus sp.]|nr:ABC transporter permease [Terracidiphilus sp.]
MSVAAWFGSLAARWFSRGGQAEGVDEELRSHIALRADDLERSGLTRAEAERRARIEFGGRVKYKEQIHEALGGNFLGTVVEDVRFSVRVLRKSPGFTVAAVFTLALAIGANAVVFGLLNALILRPLNVPHPQSLYVLEHGPDRAEDESYPDFLDLRARNRSFDSIALYNIVSVGLDTGKNPAEVMGYEVSGNYFDTLGIHPYLGRFFHDADEHGPNSAPYLVISYGYWHSHFQDDRGVVGRVVDVNKHPFTILGVAPPSFQGTLLFFFPDFWAPVVNDEQLAGRSVLNVRDEQEFIMTLGHLKAGVTPAQAIGDLNRVGAWLDTTYPKTDAHMTFTLARPALAGDLLGPAVRGFIAALMALAGLILLAACANLGSLFAARAADRSREVALRLALGSSRRRLLRAVFTEAVLISLAGGALGLAGSVALLRELSVWHPIPTFPISVPVYPDARVYWAALVLALVSAFLFGAVPVRQILRTNPYEVVKAGSSGVIAGHTARRFTARDVLLVTQIAICAVLVTSSLVAVRGLVQSMHSNFGFDPKNAMLVYTDLNMAGYASDHVPTMQRRMIEAVETIPGVKSVGSIDQIPLGGSGPTESVFTDQTTELISSKSAFDSMVYKISPAYFDAAETALLRGRAFTGQDGKGSIPVAIVNEEFARRLFGSVNNAIGRHFKPEVGPRLQVVGVVENGKYWQLTEDQKPAIFLPLLQSPSSATCLVVRASNGMGRDPQLLAAAIRAKLRNLDEALPVAIHAWSDTMSIALFPSRVASVALGALGLMAAMLAITGIFGMAAYSVSKRLRELGIRIALGARRKEVLAAALGRPLKLLVFGSSAGLLLGILATRVLAYLVYQANPRDPLVLVGVVLTMLLLGLVATWIPAQRALHVDPQMLLREE